MFMPQNAKAKQTLADIIMAKIRDTEGTVNATDVDDSMQRRLNPKVYKVYRGYGLHKLAFPFFALLYATFC